MDSTSCRPRRAIRVITWLASALRLLFGFAYLGIPLLAADYLTRPPAVTAA